MYRRNFLITRLIVGILALCYVAGASWALDTANPRAEVVQIQFESSGSPAGQKLFLKGVTLLHNFQYDDAVITFSQAIKEEPDFAMAYWGLAMSYNHPLWGEQDLNAAQDALTGLDKISAPLLTPREQGFISAVKLLYGNGDKATRDARYAEAMRQLYSQFPDDDEVASFYGLALLGTRSDNADFTITVRASDVLEKVYVRNPNHPGVLHYLVHCYDDPKYASLGLQAANRYGQVAPDSAHALHMPSHIYLDLGMWQEYIRSNEASWSASPSSQGGDHPAAGGSDIHGLHTLQWLEYGYLQQGKTTKAVDSLKAMAKIYASTPTPMVKWYLAMMRATYIVNAADWQNLRTAPDLKSVESLDLQGIELTAMASDLFATGLMAEREKQPKTLQDSIDALGKIIDQTKAAIESAADSGGAGHQHDSFFTGVYESSIKPAQIMQTQLQALQLLAEDKADEALNRLQDAVGAEDKLPAGYGPPVPVKPSAELLGEIYLRAGRPQNAMRAFQMTLLRYPNRAASLAGLSEAAKLADSRKIDGGVASYLPQMRRR